MLIKVNLARPPSKGHPRTDPRILSSIVKFISDMGCRCAIAECADGHLKENLFTAGLGYLLEKPLVSLIDLDLEDFIAVPIADEEHYIPACLRDYDIRIAIPATSKRPESVFSNNVKLFVGAVPRKMYQTGGPGKPVSYRPKIHLNLHASIVQVYQAVMKYAPFHVFINGGMVMQEGIGEYCLKHIFIGDNGVELDQYMVNKIFCIPEPDYLNKLRGFNGVHISGCSFTP